MSVLNDRNEDNKPVHDEATLTALFVCIAENGIPNRVQNVIEIIRDDWGVHVVIKSAPDTRQGARAGPAVMRVERADTLQAEYECDNLLAHEAGRVLDV